MATTPRSSDRPPAQAGSRRRLAAPPRRLVRRRATVRKVDPWTVLKLSLIFYFGLLIIIMVALTLFWALVTRLGLIDAIRAFLVEQLQFDVIIHGGNIARLLFLLGLLNVVLWSGINVFLAFLYNLVADLVGGLRLTLAEEE